MFSNRRKNLAYFFILVITFLLFFSQTDLISSIKFNLIHLTAQPARLLTLPFIELKKILYYHRTYDEWNRLYKEQGALKARLVGLEEVVRENTRLGKLLQFKRNSIYSSVTASVIGRDPSLWNSSMVIDKGSVDGIQEGQAVVNDYGVVGKIMEVSDESSKVILLTDPQFSVAALVQRSREIGLVSGTLQGLCRLRFLGKDADIQLGDKIITSKLSSSFPESLIIGEVVQIHENSDGGTREGIVQPAVLFSQLEEVLVITK